MVRLTRALARGLEDTLTPAGVRLFAATLLLVTAVQLLANTYLDGIVLAAFGHRLVVDYAATLPLGSSTAMWLLVGLLFAGSWLLVVFLRSLVRDADGGIHPDDVLHEALPATIRTAVAVAVGGTLVLAGLAFGIGPGVLLAGHLLFVPVFVAIEDDGLIGAVARSWKLAAAHRVRVLTFTAVVTLLVGGIGVGSVLSTALDPWLEFLLGVGGTTAVLFVAICACVDIYRQHDDGRSTPAGTSRSHGAGAL
ncbi:MAG: hypothetical protein ABEH78_03505 [Haloferacaceae archaeon]